MISYVTYWNLGKVFCIEIGMHEGPVNMEHIYKKKITFTLRYIVWLIFFALSLIWFTDTNVDN